MEKCYSWPTSKPPGNGRTRRNSRALYFVDSIGSRRHQLLLMKAPDANDIFWIGMLLVIIAVLVMRWFL